MEKKTSRSAQPSSKGPSTDSKKTQDGASSKVWPRGGRRREPTNASLANKNDSFRKPNNQLRAAKSFDKRPRQKNAYNSSAMGRAEATRLDDNDIQAELGSVFVAGSKKQSLNHLLNFVYTPHSADERYSSSERCTKMSANRLMLTKKHKYNKEHFLQANCQFIVNSSGDYKKYMSNPDTLVDWSLIEQINVQTSEFSTCPICLYPPVAAKMTRCGHIYCWSCILHYLSLSDKTWSKCPICYESINTTDLKSVVTIPHNTFNINDVITFKLMKRAKGSLIAYPATRNFFAEDAIIELSQQEGTNSKLLIANSDQILSIIERELGELHKQIEENKDCPEKCFSEQALLCLQQRKQNVIERLDFSKKNNVSITTVDVMNEKLGKEEDLNENLCNESLETASNDTNTKYHYFYQASDGQHIYLHAINAKMLEHTYGSLEESPKVLSGRILEKEGGSMTEELRKRLRYLQHLPVTCQFEVAEIQLRTPFVHKETLEYFNEQIEIRKKRRQRRARDEKKREKRIAEEENRLFGRYPTPNLHIESETQFPCFEPRVRTESECTPPSELSFEITPSSSLIFTENDCAGPSFAKMLSSAKRSSNDWPCLKVASETIPMKLINVTGQKMQTGFKAVINHTDSDPDILEFEDALPIQSTRSLGDAIVQALERVEIEPENDAPLTGKKKKKKNKQRVLFSTTMAYSEKQQ